jgi:hypothetical protein
VNDAAGEAVEVFRDDVIIHDFSNTETQRHRDTAWPDLLLS